MTNVALIDVRHVDGEVWEVAGVAGKQVTDALALTVEALDAFFWAARGSWLSQEEYRTGEMPERGDFEKSPLGRNLLEVIQTLSKVGITVRAAATAASFDPHGL